MASTDSTRPGPSPALTSAPDLVLREGRYTLRFARSEDEVRAALRLRYEVFNLELGEGLQSSVASGLDQDEFDGGCHHMLVEYDGVVVGTYRMQTAAMATAWRGFYSSGEYDLSPLGDEVLGRSVEVGRACIHADHRKHKVLFALWRGLAAYLRHTGSRYFFGCCSLTSQDMDEALVTMEWLRREDLVRPGPLATALPGLRCEGAPPDPAAVAAVSLPTLFRTYMRFGARVCSEPAIDRAFGTIDYLVLMDTETLPRTVRLLFGLS